MPVQAILFDLWGTLIIDQAILNEPRAAERMRRVQRALAVDGPAYTLEALSVARGGAGRAYNAMQVEGRDGSMPEKVALYLEALERGLAARLTPECLRAVEDALGGAIHVSPPLAAAGAVEVLTEARRRGLRTGLVSNSGITPGYVLRELLRDHGLLSHLEVLTFSDEARLAKPSPELFACTLEALGVAPQDAVFVGDMPALDIAGPRALGMWAVQVGDEPADGLEPHVRIASLPELWAALEGLGLLG